MLGLWIGLSCSNCKVYKQELLGEARTADAHVSDVAAHTGDGGLPGQSDFDPASCAWGQCWWSTGDLDTCRSAGMPLASDRPMIADVSNRIADIYLGFTRVRVGGTNREGQQAEDAWKDFGFDLDGRCTSSTTCPADVAVGCRTSGAAVPFDGELCRDNTFARLQPVLAAVPELGEKFGLSEDAFNCALWRGSYNTIVRISGYNGEPNDSRVRVDFYSSTGIQEPFPWNCPADDFRERYPRWRTSRKWGVDESWLSEPIGAPGTLPDSKFADADAYVKHGYIVAQIPEGSEQGFIGDGAPYRGFVYKTRRALFVGQVFKAQDATWGIRDGLMAGRIRKEDLLQAFREVGFCGKDELQTFYINLQTYINEDADVLASGAVDPGADCDAMSYAVGFEAGQVSPGTAVKVPPRIECCPPGMTVEQCTAECGDGRRSGDEKCDTAIADGQPDACPISCGASRSCTRQVLRGSQCATECVPVAITTVGARDGCCPDGANATTDNDCMPSCGNGVVEAGETCDPEGSCMPCPAIDGCLMTRTTGSAETCNLRCEVTAIQQCGVADSCCPKECNASTDRDCSSTCGNGTIETGETCEPSGNTRCPTSCDDGKSCTLDQTTGSVANCNLTCTHTPITQTLNGDGCCPTGASANGDSDCRTTCGNRVVETGEECDDGNSSAGDGCVACKSEGTEQVCLVKLGASDDCARCTCSKCQAQALSCYGTGDADEAALCTNLVECKRDTGCGNPGCFCGDANLFVCVAGASDGPCKRQVIEAAKSPSLADIGARSTDNNYPLGRANALTGCTDTNCTAECGD